MRSTHAGRGWPDQRWVKTHAECQLVARVIRVKNIPTRAPTAKKRMMSIVMMAL